MARTEERHIASIRFGPMDVSVPDTEAAPGTLRLTKNLVCRGPADEPYYSPAEKAEELVRRQDVQETLSELDGVRGVHVQVRSSYGPFSSAVIDTDPDPLPQGAYDDGNGTYSPALLSDALQAHRAVAWDGVIYVVGGNDGSTPQDTLYAYDVAANSWSTLTSMPAARWGASAAVLDGVIYVVGGWDGSAHTDTLFAYSIDDDSWETLTARPIVLSWSTAEAVSGKIYVLGGEDGSGQQGVVYIYDPEEDSWSTGSTMPTPVAGHGSAVVGTSIYVVGGYDGTNVVDAVQRYHPGTDAWSTETAMPTERRRLQAVALNDRYVYAIAGMDSGDAFVTAVHEYDTQTDTWSAHAVSIPTGVRYPAAAPFGQIIYVIGGNDSASEIDNTVALAINNTTIPGTDAVADVEESLERIVAVTDASIYILDPGRSYRMTKVYDFPSQLAVKKKVQFAQIGSLTYIATSVGSDVGRPSDVLVLQDDQVMPLTLPALPRVDVQITTGSGDIDEGTYAFRFGWLLNDGTLARPGRPHLIEATSASNDSTFEFEIGAYVAALDSFWSEVITGIVIGVTQAATTATEKIETLMNSPYFRVATIEGVEVGDSVTWSDKNDNITGYPLFEDDILTMHNLRAAAVASYNKRLILGDVAVDFQKPNVIENLSGVDASGEIVNNPPQIGPAEVDAGSATDVSHFIAGFVNTLHVEVEDTDGDEITVQVEKEPAFSPGPNYSIDTIGYGNIAWELWNGSIWIAGDTGVVENTPGYTKKRLVITWDLTDMASVAPSVGDQVAFRIFARDDAGQFNERGFLLTIRPEEAGA